MLTNYHFDGLFDYFDYMIRSFFLNYKNFNFLVCTYKQLASSSVLHISGKEKLKLSCFTPFQPFYLFHNLFYL